MVTQENKIADENNIDDLYNVLEAFYTILIPE